MRSTVQTEPPASAPALAGRRRWVVSGVAGFIGSHLLQALLERDQDVVGVDSFVTGSRSNLDAVQSLVTSAQWDAFTLIEGDIRSEAVCTEACRGAQVVLHHAALASVSRSFEDPAEFSDVNVTGFLRLATAAARVGVRRFVYASSSAVYGGGAALPKHESHVPQPQSPYALNKLANEQYARLLHDQAGTTFVGLRYFNVFGPRQDQYGAYAAVIPLWLGAAQRGEAGTIYGDGSATRDFVYIDDVVDANLRAGTVRTAQAQVYNIGSEVQTSVAELYRELQGALAERAGTTRRAAVTVPERAGDVAHSVSDCSMAQAALGFRARHTLGDGLRALLAADGALAP